MANATTRFVLRQLGDKFDYLCGTHFLLFYAYFFTEVLDCH